MEVSRLYFSCPGVSRAAQCQGKLRSSMVIVVIVPVAFSGRKVLTREYSREFD